MSGHEFGTAGDIDPKFSEWLHQGNNAAQFGLEFLPGEVGVRDPNHVRLASNVKQPSKTRIDSVPVGPLMDAAEAEARQVAPNNPDFIDRARWAVYSEYRRRELAQGQEDIRNRNVIAGAMEGDTPPATLNELLAIPEASNAYYQLNNLEQQKIAHAFARINRETDEAEFKRLKGMALSDNPEEQQAFVNEDIVGNKKISTAHWSQLMNLQRQAKKQAIIAPQVALAISELRNAGLLTDEQKKDSALMQTLRGSLWDEIQVYQQVRQGYPKPDEILKMGKRLISEVTTPAGYFEWPPFSGHKYPAMFGSTTDLAMNKAMDDIKKQWADSHAGIPPTPEEIRQVYRNQLFNEYAKAKKPND